MYLRLASGNLFIDRSINKTKIDANPVATIIVVRPILLIVLSIKKLLSKPSHSKIDREPEDHACNPINKNI